MPPTAVRVKTDSLRPLRPLRFLRPLLLLLRGSFCAANATCLLVAGYAPIVAQQAIGEQVKQRHSFQPRRPRSLSYFLYERHRQASGPRSRRPSGRGDCYNNRQAGFDKKKKPDRTRRVDDLRVLLGAAAVAARAAGAAKPESDEREAEAIALEEKITAASAAVDAVSSAADAADATAGPQVRELEAGRNALRTKVAAFPDAFSAGLAAVAPVAAAADSGGGGRPDDDGGVIEQGGSEGGGVGGSSPSPADEEEGGSSREGNGERKEKLAAGAAAVYAASSAFAAASAAEPGSAEFKDRTAAASAALALAVASTAAAAAAAGEARGAEEQAEGGEKTKDDDVGSRENIDLLVRCAVLSLKYKRSCFPGVERNATFCSYCVTSLDRTRHLLYTLSIDNPAILCVCVSRCVPRRRASAVNQ